MSTDTPSVARGETAVVKNGLGVLISCSSRERTAISSQPYAANSMLLPVGCHRASSAQRGLTAQNLQITLSTDLDVS